MMEKLTCWYQWRVVLVKYGNSVRMFLRCKCGNTIGCGDLSPMESKVRLTYVWGE